jgi:hypothetical protein
LTPYLDQELLYYNSLSVDGAKIEDVLGNRFKYTLHSHTSIWRSRCFSERHCLMSCRRSWRCDFRMTFCLLFIDRCTVVGFSQSIKGKLILLYFSDIGLFYINYHIYTTGISQNWYFSDIRLFYINYHIYTTINYLLQKNNKTRYITIHLSFLFFPISQFIYLKWFCDFDARLVLELR